MTFCTLWWRRGSVLFSEDPAPFGKCQAEWINIGCPPSCCRRRASTAGSRPFLTRRLSRLTGPTAKNRIAVSILHLWYVSERYLPHLFLFLFLCSTNYLLRILSVIFLAEPPKTPDGLNPNGAWTEPSKIRRTTTPRLTSRSLPPTLGVRYPSFLWTPIVQAMTAES